MKNPKNRVVRQIAKNMMGILTLEPQNRDSLDFYDLSVRVIQAALEEAFERVATFGFNVAQDAFNVAKDKANNP